VSRRQFTEPTSHKYDKPNIVLVTIDSLRADHCGHINPKKSLTPTIDQLAEDGFTYTNAISPSIATPESMPAIFTGKNMIGNDFGEDLNSKRQEIRKHLSKYATLPEGLHDIGYETAGFTPNPYVSSNFGFDQGFDYFEDFLGSSRHKLYESLFDGLLADSPLGFPVRTAFNWLKREGPFKPWEDYIHKITSWVKR
jgi:arylsulfatase